MAQENNEEPRRGGTKAHYERSGSRIPAVRTGEAMRGKIMGVGATGEARGFSRAKLSTAPTPPAPVSAPPPAE